MKRPFKLALINFVCIAAIDQAAQAFPFQFMQQGSLLYAQRDVRQLLPARKANLVGYWRFEGNYQDASGGGNTGIANGSAALVTGGPFGQAVSLNGSTDYLSFAASILPSATNVTISVWFYQNTLPASGTLYIIGAPRAVAVRHPRFLPPMARVISPRMWAAGQQSPPLPLLRQALGIMRS